MAAVWERSNHKGSNLLVMLALADWGDDDGKNIYPAVETIAQKTRLGVRAVRYILAELEESGEVLIDRNARQNKNGQWTNVYRLNLPKERDANFAGVQKRAQKGCKVLPKGVNGVAPNPSGTIIEPTHTVSPPPVFKDESKVPPPELPVLPVVVSMTARPIPNSKTPGVREYFEEFGILPEQAQMFEIVDRVTPGDPQWPKSLHEFHVNEPRDKWIKVGWMCDRYERARQAALRPAQKPAYSNNGNGRYKPHKGVRVIPQVGESTEAQREKSREEAKARIAARAARRQQEEAKG